MATTNPYPASTAPRPPAPPLPQALVDALATVSSLNTAMSIIQTIIGLPAGDTDAIVNTVREMLAVMENLPEGEKLATHLTTIDSRLNGIPTATQALIDSALTPILALIGSTGGDADAIVNTVREVLAIMTNFPEGVNLLARLAAIDDAINNLKVPLDYDPTNPLTSDFEVSTEGIVKTNKLSQAKGIVANPDALKALVNGMLSNADTLQLLKGSLGSSGSGGGTVTPTYPSLAGAKSYITSFADGQTPFKGYRTLTYGTGTYGVYYLGAAESWGGGNNTGLVKEKIPVGGASAIAWDLPADGLLGGKSTGVAISDNLTDYFRGYYSTPFALGIVNNKFQWNINGKETLSSIAAPASGPNTTVVVDVPASGNITARYTTDGNTWTVIDGCSVVRPNIDLAPAPFIEQANRIYNFRATNLQPF